MPNFTAIAPGLIYHVCSRGNNREDIFRTEQDRRHFLQLYEKRVLPGADTFAYCLLPNHFHLLVRFRDPDPELTTPPSRILGDMLNAYARSFNLDHGRVGAWFQRPFRRIPVKSQEQSIHLVVYIHRNPEHHGLQQDALRWKYSSYPALLAATSTRLRREEVLSWEGADMALHWPTLRLRRATPLQRSYWRDLLPSPRDTCIRHVSRGGSNTRGPDALLP